VPRAQRCADLAAYAVGVPDETDAFGRPSRPEEPDALLGWQPPVAPVTEAQGEWEAPVSPTPGPSGAPAGWWRRAGAAIIDGLAVGVVGVIVALVLSGALGASEDATTAISVFVGLLVGSFYYGNLMSREGPRNGQSMGKQAVGIRVVRVDGRPVTFGFALHREILVKTIVFGYLAAFTLYIATVLNYLWPVWDRGNRALHDHVCKTLVRTAV
jgi:uncharacterized RDD family membrane protein YckC